MKIKSKLTKQVFVFSLLFVVAACGIFSKSVKIDMKQNYMFYKPFVLKDSNLIKTHWRQYFTHDIIPEMTDFKTEDYHPIFLDNYGVVYPEETIYKDDFNFRENNEVNILDNGSHFKVFNENSKLRNIIMKKGFDSTKYECKNWEDSLTPNFVKTTHFNQAWNNFFLPQKTSLIKDKLKNKKNIVFFIHGYNVPYSLAVMQLTALRNKMKEFNLNMDSTLFVPIFWPSNSQKICKISSLDNFNVGDSLSKKNIYGWLTYSNQAYYASLTFRKILIELQETFINKNINVMIISHSLGATIVTSSIIKKNSKIKFNKKTKSNYIENNIFNIDLINRFNSESIPTYKFKVFLSAPAIPGKSTFINISDNFKSVVFSTYNKKDRMVTKFKILPRKLGSTSLGCNKFNEIKKVQKIFATYKIANNFKTRKVSNRQDHDIFTYLRQPEYCAFLKEFINHKIEQK